MINKTFYTVGPCEMFPQTLALESKQTPYFRNDYFSNIYKNVEQLTLELSNAPKDSKVIMLTASGTGAMEATITNIFNKNDKLLIINGGGFGKRFCEISDIHNIPYDTIDLEFDETLDQSHFDQFENENYTALLVNIHETSTGQLYSMELCSDFCKRNNMYFIVDAISSFLSDNNDIAKYNIDSFIFSSQKALALNPGLSTIIISPKMYIERIRNSKPKSLYFDFNSHIENGLRGQTPFTPAVSIIITMQEALSRIKKIGMQNQIDNTLNLAQYFRDSIQDLPTHLPSFPMSNTLTTIIFPKKNAKDTCKLLNEKYDLIVTPNGGELGEKILRVGHIGNMNKEKIDKLVHALKEIL